MPTYYFTINHTTRFNYAAPIRESVMEVRMRPRDEWGQQCLAFDLSVSPRANVFSYRDAMGNHVHHFDIPSAHISETVSAESIVRVDTPAPAPEHLHAEAWDQLEQALTDPDIWEMTQPSRYCTSTALLDKFADDIGCDRLDCPLRTAHQLTRLVHDHLEYRQKHTRVDSPIDEALAMRAGVCQDFAHIMITLGRKLGLPCRYVSGYLASDPDVQDRTESTEATHAWVEVYLPTLGWTGFDPTHGNLAGEWHVRTAIGRDYSDVPPTRGVYRGNAPGELMVAVEVTRLMEPPPRAHRFEPTGWGPPEPIQVFADELKPFDSYAQQVRQQQHEER